MSFVIKFRIYENICGKVEFREMPFIVSFHAISNGNFNNSKLKMLPQASVLKWFEVFNLGYTKKLLDKTKLLPE